MIFFFEFGQVDQMSFKGLYYLELWKHLYSAERNHLRHFGRGHHEEQFCEIVLNLEKWVRCHFKNSYLELWRPFCLAEQTH